MPPIRIKNRSDLENIEETNGRYVLIGADFRDSDLPFTNFFFAKLDKAKFNRAYLIRSIFKNAQLKKAEFIMAKLGAADFEDANLTGADLRTADLQNTNFKGAILKNASLGRAMLLFTNFQGADLRGADLRDAMRYDSANFQGADLRGAKFNEEHKLYFKGAIFTDEDLKDKSSDSVNEVWVADEVCAGQQDPISLDNIPADRGFRLKADELKRDKDNLINCFDISVMAELVKSNRSSNKPLISPRTRKPLTSIDIERIDKYISLNPSGGRQKQKSKKQRKGKKSRKSRKGKKSRKIIKHN